MSFLGGYSSTNLFHVDYNIGALDKSDLDNDHVTNHVTNGFSIDYNALYASSLTTFLPYRNYRILRPEDPSLEFTEIVANLTKLNIDFFHELSTIRKTGLLLDLEIDYDHTESLLTSLDFAMFPSFKAVEMSELSEDQQRQALKMNKKLNREPPKLVSTMERRQAIDFIENFLFLIVHQSCRIVKVNLIVAYEHSDYFREYLSFLQTQRAAATSSIEAKMVKALGNSLVGRMHMKLESYQQAVICANEAEFFKAASSLNFLDFHILGKNAVLAIKDGGLVKTRNVPSLSAR